MRLKNFGSKGLGPVGLIIVVIFLLVVGGLAISFIAGLSLQNIIATLLVQFGIWVVLLIGGTVVVIFSMTMMQISKSARFYTLAKIGMVMISFSVVVLIVMFILPIFLTKPLNYEECKSFVEIQGKIEEQDVYRTISCIFAGYAPTRDATTVTYVNFIIISIIAPFVFFYYIFADLIATMNFPSNPGAQKAIAFIGAYSALRGAMSTYFVEFFAYSWYGMGVLAFGIFMMMMAWALIRKYFESVIEPDRMKQIFRILAGDVYVSPSTLFNIICQERDAYDFVNSNILMIQNFLSKVGYSGKVAELNAIMAAAATKPSRSRNNYVKNELRRVLV